MSRRLSRSAERQERNGQQGVEVVRVLIYRREEYLQSYENERHGNDEKNSHRRRVSTNGGEVGDREPRRHPDRLIRITSSVRRAPRQPPSWRPTAAAPMQQAVWAERRKATRSTSKRR
jgi:hypothetical protein